MITGGDLRQSRLDVGYKTFTISPWGVRTPTLDPVDTEDLVGFRLLLLGAQWIFVMIAMPIDGFGLLLEQVGGGKAVWQQALIVDDQGAGERSIEMKMQMELRNQPLSRQCRGRSQLEEQQGVGAGIVLLEQCMGRETNRRGGK